MYARRSNPVIVAACLTLAAYAGCRRDARSSQAATRPARPVLTLIATESLQWSRSDACAKLGDEKLGVSAAVRLVRLVRASPLCVPEDLTDDLVRRLRLVALSPERWALGLAAGGDERRLRAPVLISADGEVTPLAEDVEEEVLVLHVAADADVFPHLAMLPDRVLVIDDEVSTAIALEPEQPARFELREQRGIPYVALVLLPPNSRDEVTRFAWEPYERVFMGPAADKLPDPPGGEFRVNLQASQRLVPMGGELPETRPVPEPPPDPPERPQRKSPELLPT